MQDHRCPEIVRRSFYKAQQQPPDSVTDAIDSGFIENTSTCNDQEEQNSQLQLFVPNDSDYTEDVEAQLSVTNNWTPTMPLNSAMLNSMNMWLEGVKERSQMRNDAVVDVDPGILSDEQFVAFALCVKSILCKLQNVSWCCKLHILGSAGSGKTTTINAVLSFAAKLIKMGNRNVSPYDLVKLAAPTGTAAFLINGSTLHSLLRIPPKYFKELSDGQTLHSLQRLFQNTGLLFIDEKSMIGKASLFRIDSRLRQIHSMKQDCSLGNLSTALVGDFAQLPPMGDTPLYTNEAKSKETKSARALFQEFDFVVNLSRNYRVLPEELVFAQYLERHREGNVTLDDWNMLAQRQFHLLPPEEQALFQDATRLYTTNRATDEYNLRKLIELNNPIVKLISENTGTGAASASFDDACGLAKVLYLAVNCRVMLTANLWTEAGLTNGTFGKVAEIIYEDNNDVASLPLYVLVQFEGYKGECFNGLPGMVCISPLQREWTGKHGACIRKQFPFILAHAITAHKAQGKTLRRVVVDIGEKEFLPGLSYVATSRVRRLQDIVFHPMRNFERYEILKNCPSIKQRVNSEMRYVEQSVATMNSPEVKAIVRNIRHLVSGIQITYFPCQQILPETMLFSVLPTEQRRLETSSVALLSICDHIDHNTSVFPLTYI